MELEQQTNPEQRQQLSLVCSQVEQLSDDAAPPAPIRSPSPSSSGFCVAIFFCHDNQKWRRDACTFFLSCRLIAVAKKLDHHFRRTRISCCGFNQLLPFRDLLIVVTLVIGCSCRPDALRRYHLSSFSDWPDYLSVDPSREKTLPLSYPYPCHKCRSSVVAAILGERETVWRWRSWTE